MDCYQHTTWPTCLVTGYWICIWRITWRWVISTVVTSVWYEDDSDLVVMLFPKRRCRFWYSWCYLLRLDGFLRVSSLHIYKWMMHAYAWYWAKRMFTASIRSTLLPIHWFLIQHLWHLEHLVFQLLLWPILLDCLLWACQLWWVVNYLLSVFFSQSMQLHSLQASEQDF